MKKSFFILLIFYGSYSLSQTPGLQLFENSRFQINSFGSKPRLIGKVGANFMMIDFSLKGTALSVFDSSFKLLTQKEQFAVFYSAHKYIIGDSLRVSWNEFHSDQDWLCLQTFDQNGVGNNVLVEKIENPNHQLLHFVTDKKNRYSFFYTVSLIDSPNVILKGVILDQNWNKIKEVSGSFILNSLLERAPLPIIDAGGNIQVIVYDKLSNFRLSTTITINTLLLNSNVFTKETFRLDNKKLYDPLFYDDQNKNQLVMTDFFYEGQTKEKKGIITLKIPYERGKQLIPVFQEIPDSIKIDLRSKTKFIRAKQSLLESIITTDMFENNGSSIFLTDLLDLPIHQLVRDVEVEPEFRSRDRSKFRYNSKGNYSTIGNNSTNTARNINASSIPVKPPQTVMTTNPRTGESTTRVIPEERISYVNPNTYSLDGLKNSPAKNSPTKTSNPFTNQINEKRALFFIDHKGILQWHKYLPEDYGSLRFSQELPISYGLKTENEIQFIHYYPTGIAVNSIGKQDQGKYAMRFSIISISEKGIKQSIINDVSEEGTVFHKPLLIAPGKYLMPYTNLLLSKSGLALLQIEN